MAILRMNKSTKHFVGKLVGAVHIGSDEDGNPAYELYIEQQDGNLWKGQTQKYATFVYGITNLLGKKVQVSFAGAKTVTNCRSV